LTNYVTKLKYINRGYSHITSWFFVVELGFKPNWWVEIAIYVFKHTLLCFRVLLELLIGLGVMVELNEDCHWTQI